jgi:hypothetical protein
VQLGTTQDKLRSIGVDTLAVVNTPAERARLYFKYRPARVLLAVDPDASIHQAYRLPAVTVLEDERATSWPQSATLGQFLATPINPTRELPAPQHCFAAMETLNKKDGFEPNEVDQQVAAAHGTQLVGHFLIDREGIVRWRHLEAAERLEDLSKFPTDEEILTAARGL